MKSDLVYVNSNGLGLEQALGLAARVMAYRMDDNKKTLLHLRLLTEEMMGLMNGINGELKGFFWIESEGKDISLHLITNFQMYRKARSELLSISTNGKNSASVGIIGKLRNAFETLFEPDDKEVASMLQMGLINVSNSENGLIGNLSGAWSMNQYRSSVQKYREGSEESAKAWDELEKSVIANLADEVNVSIKGNDIEMIVYKRV